VFGDYCLASFVRLLQGRRLETSERMEGMPLGLGRGMGRYSVFPTFFLLLPKDSQLMETVINSAIRWNNAEDDDIVEEANEKILKRAMDLAKEMDVYHPYIYSNYAGKNQVVLEGYGEASSERLKRIRKEVDPEGVFEILTPGYFKL
jgi:hypothetical protein